MVFNIFITGPFLEMESMEQLEFSPCCFPPREPFAKSILFCLLSFILLCFLIWGFSLSSWLSWNKLVLTSERMPCLCLSSVVIQGIDHWAHPPAQAAVVFFPRLLRKLHSRLEADFIICLNIFRDCQIYFSGSWQAERKLTFWEFAYVISFS